MQIAVSDIVAICEMCSALCYWCYSNISSRSSGNAITLKSQWDTRFFHILCIFLCVSCICNSGLSAKCGNMHTEQLQWVELGSSRRIHLDY